jgi:hypothetical protein
MDVMVGNDVLKANIIDARDCGANPNGEELGLAIVSFGNPPRWLRGEHYVRPSQVLKREACATPLKSIAADAASNDDFMTWLGVARAEIALTKLKIGWSSAGLAVTVTEVAFPANSRWSEQEQQQRASALQHGGQALRTIPVHKIEIRSGTSSIELEDRLLAR